MLARVCFFFPIPARESCVSSRQTSEILNPHFLFTVYFISNPKFYKDVLIMQPVVAKRLHAMIVILH